MKEIALMTFAKPLLLRVRLIGHEETLKSKDTEAALCVARPRVRSGLRRQGRPKSDREHLMIEGGEREDLGGAREVLPLVHSGEVTSSGTVMSLKSAPEDRKASKSC